MDEKMTISKYSDDELLEEVKARGFKIKILEIEPVKAKLTIGGIQFELTR
jgi:hypothetical protein